jgi:hypothetical protein
MIELLFPCEYSWVNATIDICTLADYSVAKEHRQAGQRKDGMSRLRGSDRLHLPFIFK